MRRVSTGWVRAAVGVAVAVGLSLGVAACSGAGAPLPEGYPAPERPVVLVPGITGSALRTPERRVAFGTARQLFLPRDGGYLLTRALDGSSPAFDAFDLLREIDLGIYRKPIYQPLIDLLGAVGYPLGDPERPTASPQLYPFAYDWRQDNLDNAARLAVTLRRIADASGGRVDLICQSNGAHLCRWAARYGELGLEKAESVEKGAEIAVHRPPLGRLVLVGTSNGGSLRILQEMNRGRRYLPLVGRRFLPETFFTFPSLYLDLPFDSTDLFVDAGGERLDIELHDAASWERYGWSIFAPESSARADRHSALFGTREERRSYLERQLERSRRAQTLLGTGVSPPDAVSYHLIENGSAPTSRRAMVERRGARWRTLFAGDRGVTAAARRRLTEAGDGHSVLASQRHLTPAEAAVLAPPKAVGGGHFEMLQEAETERYLLDVLALPLPPVSLAAGSGNASNPSSK